MIFYIDESGSINNHLSHNKYFVIALVRVLNKKSLKRSYKRFVSSTKATYRRRITSKILLFPSLVIILASNAGRFSENILF